MGLKIDQTKVPSALLDKPAKPFKAAWIQGKDLVPSSATETFNLDDFKGKPMVLNFWASWCYSCRAEAKDFEKFWRSQKGVSVVGIAIQDTVEDAERFARMYGKTYILGLDTDGKVALDYGVTGVPETFFINEKGIIIHKEAGPVTEETLKKYTSLLTAGKSH